MRKHESWRTRKYWSNTGGLLIEEFLAVSTTKANGQRLIDGVIVLNEETGIYDGNVYDIEGKDVIVIQTKRSRIGMNLLGQAYFSKCLIEKLKPRSIKSVAICSKYDDVIGQLAKANKVEVVVISDKGYDAKFDSPKYLEENKTLYNMKK
jgi:hypothetical protein